MGVGVNVLSEVSVAVEVCCPECGEPIPVTITATVTVCDCGRHQGLETTPDFTDVAAHIWLHEETV